MQSCKPNLQKYTNLKVLICKIIQTAKTPNPQNLPSFSFLRPSFDRTGLDWTGRELNKTPYKGKERKGYQIPRRPDSLNALPVFVKDEKSEAMLRAAVGAGVAVAGRSCTVRRIRYRTKPLVLRFFRQLHLHHSSSFHPCKLFEFRFRKRSIPLVV